MVEKVLSVNERKNGVTGTRGSSVKGILFFLFALAVCFGYFYFFTDVLRSKEDAPEQTDVYYSEVKKPLPERLVQSSATSGKEAVSPPPGPAALSETPLSGTLPIAKTNTAAVGETVKKIPGPAAKKKVSDDPHSNHADSRKNPAKLTLPETKKTAASAITKAGSKGVSTTGGQTKKVVSGQQPTAKKVAILKKEEMPAAPGAKKVGEKFTLVVGTYVLQSSMRADKLKLEKSGLQTTVMPGKMIQEPMNRLLVAEVASSLAAKDELAKLKKASKDAFFLRANNKYLIYAGSYFTHDSAIQEQERLRKLGFAPILKKSQVLVPTYSLSAGSYPTQAAALKGAERLKKLGFQPYPVELSK